MRDAPIGTPWLGRLGRGLLHTVVVVALALLVLSGIKLAGDQAYFGQAAMPWLTHRRAAGLMIVCAIAYVLFTGPWPKARDDGAATLVLIRGGPPALREIRARLWLALVTSAAALIASGALLASSFGAGVEQALVGVHLASGGLLILFATIFTVAGVLAAADAAGDPTAAVVQPPEQPVGRLVYAVDLVGRAPPSGAAQRLARVSMYFAGCVLFSLGVKLFIDASLGTDPLSSMALGIVGLIAVPGVEVGLVSSAVTLLMLLLWSFWTRRRPPISTFVTMAIVGYLIDGWNALGIEDWTEPFLSPIAMMLTGLFLDAHASALIIMSGFGIRVVDLLALTMVERFRMRFFEAKLLIEGTFFVVAWATGGPLGVATVAFIAIVAPFVEPFVVVNRYVLRLPFLGPTSAMPRP